MRLGDVIVSFNKQRVPLSAQQRKTRQGNYRYYGAQGVIDWIDGYIFDGEYMLVAEDGENLLSRKQPVAYLVDGQFWVNNHAHILRCNESADIRFLCYMLNAMDISAYITGSAQPKLSQSSLNAIEVDLPDIDTQRAIADTLVALDDRIANNKKINHHLEQMAQAIFKSWFVDFEPWGGVMPADWQEFPLDKVMEISTKTLNPQSCPYEIIEHYSIPAFDETRLPVFEKASEIKSNKYIIDKDCFLISKLNPTTKRIWRPYCISDYPVCSTEFIVYRAKNRAHKDFYYSVIDSPAFTDFLLSHVTGSTGSRQRAIPSSTLLFLHAIPSDEIIENFCDKVAAIYAQFEQNHLENLRLRQVRDTLLPKLMSGELSIADLAAK